MFCKFQDGLRRFIGKRGRFKRLESRTLDDRRVGAIIFILGEKFTNFFFNKCDEVGIWNLVNLVQEHNNLGHANLLRKENVLARLWHHAVSCRNDENGTVHLSGAGNHVFDVVGVSRRINVRVVTRIRFVLVVRERDSNTARLFFRRIVNFVNALLFGVFAGEMEHVKNRRGERRFPVVNVANGAYVHMRFLSFKCFSHKLRC